MGIFFWCIFLKGIIYGGQVIPSTLQLSLKFMSRTASTSRIPVIISRCFGTNHRPDIDVFQDEGIQTNCNDPLALFLSCPRQPSVQFLPPDSVFVSTVTAYKSIRVALLRRWPPRRGINAPAVPSCWLRGFTVQSDSACNSSSMRPGGEWKLSSWLY